MLLLKHGPIKTASDGFVTTIFYDKKMGFSVLTLASLIDRSKY
jgi:hypothetical protein